MQIFLSYESWFRQKVMNTKLYANVPCSTKKGLAKETFAERRKFDGIKVVGNIDNNTSIEFSSEITIVNCKFHHLNRNGITVQYGASKVIIDNNEFEENEGDIDMEPTSDDGITPYSVIISNNSFSRLVPKGWSISLSGKNNPYSKNIEQRFILTNNIIKNGGIWT